MTRSERLAEQLDWYWHKNLRPQLDGLTDEEYFWEPVRGCWSIRPRGTSAAPMSAGSGEWTMDSASPGPVPAPVTTIAWRLAHIIVSCLGYRVGWYFGGQDVDSETFAYAGTADEALKQLDEMYGRWNAGVRELSDADLENPPTVGPERFPMENRVLHVNKQGADPSRRRDFPAARPLPLAGRSRTAPHMTLRQPVIELRKPTWTPDAPWLRASVKLRPLGLLLRQGRTGRAAGRSRGDCRRCMGRADHASSRCMYLLHPIAPPGDDEL